MNEGVKILLERIKTNPEEFDGVNPKWNVLINAYKGVLESEDRDALENAMNGLLQQRFTERVMKELLAPEEDDSLGKSWYTAQKIGTPRGGATLGAYSNTATSTILDAQAYQSEMMRQHLDQHREHLKTVEVRKKAVLRKPHETLFGKLKNYLHSDE